MCSWTSYWSPSPWAASLHTPRRRSRQSLRIHLKLNLRCRRVEPCGRYELPFARLLIDCPAAPKRALVADEYPQNKNLLIEIVCSCVLKATVREQCRLRSSDRGSSRC